MLCLAHFRKPRSSTSMARSGLSLFFLFSFVHIALLPSLCFAADPTIFYDFRFSYITVSPLGVPQQVHLLTLSHTLLVFCFSSFAGCRNRIFFLKRRRRRLVSLKIICSLVSSVDFSICGFRILTINP